MSKDINIVDLKKLKYDLELELGKIVSHFQKDTGVTVKSVDFRFGVSTPAYFGESVVDIPDVTIELKI